MQYGCPRERIVVVLVVLVLSGTALSEVLRFQFFGVARLGAGGQARGALQVVEVSLKSTATGVCHFAQYKRSTGIPGIGSYYEANVSSCGVVVQVDGIGSTGRSVSLRAIQVQYGWSGSY